MSVEFAMIVEIEEERGWRKWEVGIYIGILLKYSNAYSN